ncbi:phosphotransferase [Solwaraspora sp. WMMD406]|uniref:phosphotransferase n=1 Tax=Solwaraspora sp. WMMD406 TaxID=3016095 RepID=UPI00241670BD|nr:phosphotransferase [Solwaraspora sp. WMMD406]MDG4765263.1 phosphotransferase [Solwaraspora sp. WMMD406]
MTRPATSRMPWPATTRVPWPAAPAAFRAAVVDLLGAPVVADTTQPGGFSRGVASRLRCADGRRVFVKAIDTTDDGYALSLYEREARVAPQLPLGLPAPWFVGTVRAADWLGLVFHDVPGQIVTPPWTSGRLRLVVDCLTSLSALATPCPVADLPDWGGPASQWHGWNHMLATGGVPADDAELDPATVVALAALERDYPQAAAGDTLLHSDLRADNIMLAADNTDSTVTLVDWAQAARGAAWLDPLIFALGAALDGVPEPDGLFLRHRAARAAPAGAVDRVLAALAGRFVYLARTPGPAPVRALQQREARICLDWLHQRHAL